MMRSRSVATSREIPNQFAEQLFNPLPARYNVLAALLSFGQDGRWRSTIVDQISTSDPTLVLDVACGPGAVTRRLAKRTKAKIVGIDLTEAMLREGQRNVRHSRLEGRVALVLGRGEQLPFGDATFDALTFTYLLRYVSDPAATVRELARVLKPGARVASLEFCVPERRGWRMLWWLYTRMGLPVAGYLTGGRAWWDVGRFLGPSISRHYRDYPVEWLVNAWREAGFEHVEYRRMSLGGGLVMWGYRSG